VNKTRIRKLARRLNSRLPLVGGWLRRRAARQLGQAAEAGWAPAAEHLAEAVVHHADPDVRQIAEESLDHVDRPPCIGAVAAVWKKSRNATLRQLILQHEWLADEPPDVRMWNALLIGRLQPVTQGGTGIVPSLIQACDDDESEIAQRARDCVRRLSRQKTVDALCEAIIEDDHPVARQLAIEAGHAPSQPHRQALFYFLTGQWERYEDLDFDQRLLGTVYESADPRLRRRITAQLRASGRIDLLPLVTGGDRLTRVSRMTRTEADLLIEMLSQHGQWEKLWRLVLEFPLAHSARALGVLADANWRPERHDERLIFEQLHANARVTSTLSAGEVSRVLPPALECERIKVPGRINSVAFSPARPILAIGTGLGRVVLWDFHRAERLKLLRDFERSVGCVNFTADGTLVCGERSSSSYNSCAVVVYPSEEPVKLTAYDGAVTALEPVAGSQLLTAGKASQIDLWDVASRQLVQSRELSYWPRALRVSPAGDKLVLLHKSISMMPLPELDDERRSSWDPFPGVSACADFAPDGQAVIAGKHNGKVVVFGGKGKRLTGEREPLASYSGQVQSVQSLTDRRIVISADSGGKVTFTAWENRSMVGQLTVVGERLTSLTVSPDGAYMAIGDSDASLTLWDLRVLDIPLLFNRPLARAVPGHLAVVRELSESRTLDDKIVACLTYMQDALKHRFRYDIEIDDVPTIKVGEFDIEIE
jgi:hypothetical protein